MKEREKTKKEEKLRADEKEEMVVRVAEGNATFIHPAEGRPRLLPFLLEKG